MDAKQIIELLGIGLSRVLRYTFPAALLVLTFALVDNCQAKLVYDTLGWPLSIFCALVIGIGIYAVHRGLVIPIHHLLGCAILRVGDFICGRVEEQNSLSPTRWLHSLGVPRFRLILAYDDLRRWWFNERENPNNLDKEERNALDIIHAENGLPVMLSEALLVAWFYLRFPEILDWRFLLGIALFFFSALSGMQQHRVECAHFRTDPNRVREIVRKFTNSA